MPGEVAKEDVGRMFSRSCDACRNPHKLPTACFSEPVRSRRASKSGPRNDLNTNQFLKFLKFVDLFQNWEVPV